MATKNERFKFDPLCDGKSFLELIDWMGKDLSIVNAARNSFDVFKETLDERDLKLIHRLLNPPEGGMHTSPMRGVVFTFRVKAPIFVCRQWWKHHIASSHLDEQNQWNERSFRYDEADEGDFYVPKQFRKQDPQNKQVGSLPLDSTLNETIYYNYKLHCQQCFSMYKWLLKNGVCKEQSRGVLPSTYYTTFIWTVSLQALLNFIDLRDFGKGAQNEISAYIPALKECVELVAPNTLAIWREKRDFERRAKELFMYISNKYGVESKEEFCKMFESSI